MCLQSNYILSKPNLKSVFNTLMRDEEEQEKER